MYRVYVVFYAMEQASLVSVSTFLVVGDHCIYPYYGVWIEAVNSCIIIFKWKNFQLAVRDFENNNFERKVGI